MAEINDVRAALHALYHHQDKAARDAADRWLEAWQQSPGAWSTSDALLHDAASNLEQQYFCAQTLRTKVQRDFEELPAEAVDSLRGSLFALVLKFHRGCAPVRTQLCLALAALAAHCPAERWGEHGPLRWFADRCSSVPADVAWPCMLELLTVLPQEAESNKIAIRPERRRRFEGELAAAFGDALAILSSCLSPSQEGTQQQALEAFAAWLRLLAASGAVDPVQLLGQPLVAAALEGLSGSGGVFHAAADAVCELIWATVRSDGSIAAAAQALVSQIVATVMTLRPRFVLAAQRAADDDTGGGVGGPGASDAFDDDEDSAKAMARLFAEAGEAYITLIATATPEVRGPVDALLEVAAYPDNAICSMSFAFWNKLAGQLAAPRPAGTEGVSPELAAQEAKRRREFFAPAFARLVELIRGRVKYPDDWSSMSRNEKSDFREGRHAIGDTLIEACEVLGPVAVIELLLAPLQGIVAAANAGKTFDWRGAEAVLFCVREVTAAKPPPGCAPLQQLLSFLPQLPRSEGLLLSMACTLSGACAAWLAASTQQGLCGGLLGPLVDLLLAGLDNSQAAAAASSAFRKLCSACGGQLGGSSDALLRLYSRALAGGAMTNQLAPAGPDGNLHRMEEADVLLILEGVWTAVIASSPPATLRGAASSLIAPILQPLTQLLQQLPPPPDAAGGAPPPPQPATLLPLVNRLATVFATGLPSDVAAELLAAAWPPLAAVFQRVSGDPRGTEVVARALRHGIKAARKACAGLLPVLLDALPSLFEASRHSAFLYIVSELVKTFGDEPSCEAPLAGLLSRLLHAACGSLPTLERMTEDPELVDDAFLLAERALNYCPKILVTPTLLPALLDVALRGVLLQHREAGGSCISFLERLIQEDTLRKCPPEAANLVTSVFLPQAPLLTRLLLAGAVGALPSARLRDVATALAVILKAAGAQGLSWLEAAISVVPDTSAAPDDKARLLSAAGDVARMGPAYEGKAFVNAIYELADVTRRNKRARLEAQRPLLPPELSSAVLLR